MPTRLLSDLPDRMAARGVVDYPSSDDMEDVGNHYGEGGQQGQGPYYDYRLIDPNLDNALRTGVANMDLDLSPTQAHTGQVSSETPTPRHGPKRTPTSSAKHGKKKCVSIVEPEPEPESEDEEEDEDEDDGDRYHEDEDDEPEEDEDEYDEPSPYVRKPARMATKHRHITPKSSKMSRTVLRTPLRQSARKSAVPARHAMPHGRVRRTPKDGITAARPIPRSYDECDAADKALIDGRDVEKKTWAAIRVIWEQITGSTSGSSTLPNRYERLKDNFSIIKEEDRPLLLEAKQEVDAEMAEKKWVLIAARVKELGGVVYAPNHLQRAYKRLMVREGYRPPPGVVDQDYDLHISNDDRDDDD